MENTDSFNILRLRNLVFQASSVLIKDAHNSPKCHASEIVFNIPWD